MQERAICKIVELMSKHTAQEPRTLFVMGSYRIGKERAYLGAAKALGYRCHVNADKLRVSVHDTTTLLLQVFWVSLRRLCSFESSTCVRQGIWKLTSPCVASCSE